MERSTHLSWENPLFLWPFSIAMLVHQRVLLQFSPVLENAAPAEILSSPRCLQIGPPRRCVMQPKKSQPWAVELVGWGGWSPMIYDDLWPIGSMVLLYRLYMVTWIPSIYPLYVSIYTSTMDPSWVGKLPVLWNPNITRPGGPSRWPRGQEAAAGGEGNFLGETRAAGAVGYGFSGFF